jgi:predicted peptidase
MTNGVENPPKTAALGSWRTIQRAAGYNYLLALPRGYEAQAERRWPLMLFLHGAAQRGSDLSALTLQGVPRLLSNAADLTPLERTCSRDIAEHFVVVAPQCPHNEVWDEAMLLELLDEVGGELRIDAARVYLTGLSMGAFGVWSLGLRHVERFAALLAVCGGGRIADVQAAARRHRAALETLGVWAFHGALDVVVPLEESERMVAALRGAGVRDVALTVYPEAAHDAWTATFSNPEIYAWLRRHAR